MEGVVLEVFPFSMFPTRLVTDTEPGGVTSLLFLHGLLPVEQIVRQGEIGLPGLEPRKNRDQQQNRGYVFWYRSSMAG